MNASYPLNSCGEPGILFPPVCLFVGTISHEDGCAGGCDDRALPRTPRFCALGRQQMRQETRGRCARHIRVGDMPCTIYHAHPALFEISLGLIRLLDMRKSWALLGVTALLLLAAADDAVPVHPKSPKAADAIRMNNAAHRKAASAYWLDSEAADRKLEQELKSAADAAYARNDGTEEQACLDAVKDVQARIGVEDNARVNNSPPAALDPLRCEKKDAEKKDVDKKDDSKKDPEKKPA
jgi:hypothetical protein